MSFSPTLCYTAGMASIINDGKVEQRPGALSHVTADLGNGTSLTTEPPESKEIDAEEGITEHGLQLYILDPIGWKFRCFITSLTIKGMDFSKGMGSWSGGYIHVEALYKPDHDCTFVGAQLIQVMPNGKKRIIRERYWDDKPIVANKDTIGEVNLSIRYE